MGHTFTPAINADPAIVADIRRQLAERIPRKRPAKHNPAAARVAMERRGESALTAEPTEPSKKANAFVRVFYTSMGGEILAMDSEIMTSNTADNAAAAWARWSDAIGMVVFVNGEAKRTSGRLPAGWQMIRVVYVPSHTERIDGDITPIIAAPSAAPEPMRDLATAASLRGAGAYSLRRAA